MQEWHYRQSGCEVSKSSVSTVTSKGRMTRREVFFSELVFPASHFIRCEETRSSIAGREKRGFRNGAGKVKLTAAKCCIDTMV